MSFRIFYHPCRPAKGSPCRGSDGFTIVELMIGLVIAAIIAGFAVNGSIRSWLDQRGLSTATEQLRGDLQRAKLLAIKRQSNCTLTIDNSTQYTISLSGQVVDLTDFRGNVTISTAPGSQITFTPWGTCSVTIAAGIQLTSVANPAQFRVRASLAGAITKQVYSGANWVATEI
jgi:prepilin-type N-terminal cleavage/methylation domain-containing protein